MSVLGGRNRGRLLTCVGRAVTVQFVAPVNPRFVAGRGPPSTSVWSWLLLVRTRRAGLDLGYIIRSTLIVSWSGKGGLGINWMGSTDGCEQEERKYDLQELGVLHVKME